MRRPSTLDTNLVSPGAYIGFRVRGKVLTVALALALLGLTGEAAAAQRFASPTGSGTACTQATPCGLATAVEDPAVNDGDEVIVTPGPYTLASLTVSDAIDLHGQALQPTPTINVSGPFGVYLSDAATVRDLTIAGASVGVHVGFGSSSATLERLSVSAASGGGTACIASDSVIIRDTLCWGNATNTKGLGANTNTFAGTYSVRLRNVTAVGTGSGIGFNVGGSGAIFDIDARNVIADGAYDVVATASSGATTTITMANSNYATELESTVGGGTSATVTDPGTGTNQTATPLFVNAGAGDFHQVTGSPTIDAGVLDSFTGTGDFDGDARTLEGDGVCPTAPDIGADEFIGAGPIDCDPPETTISGGPTGTTSDATPTFDLVSNEAGSTFECRLDSAAFAACTTPHTTAPLADGSHTFEVRATDTSGNTDPTPASRGFTVDTTVALDTDAPETTITSAPKRRVKTKRKRAKVTLSFSSDESGGAFECALDREPFAPCTSPVKVKVKKGKHTFSVRAVDAAGNADATPATAKFKVKRKRKRE